VINAVLATLDDWLERRRSPRWGDWASAVVLTAPALVVLGVFGIFPLLYAGYISLFDLQRGVGAFTGAGNYVRALGDAALWRSLLVTLYYAAGTVLPTMVLSFVLASLLFRVLRGRGTLRTLYFLPYITSVVAAAMVWRTLLNPAFGPVNALLESIGLPTQQWLLEPRGVLHILSAGTVPPTIGPSLALVCVILFDIWHGTGFMTVVFLAGLSAVPRELDEAARMDGAGAFRRAWLVTLPLLSPTVFFLGVVGVIRAFQAFNSFYALTGGGRGPLDTTRNMTVFIYTTFYEEGRWGYGAAVAVLFSGAIMALTLLQWRYLGRKVHRA
jgi:multiple sugar transport system permease protein